MSSGFTMISGDLTVGFLWTLYQFEAWIHDYNSSVDHFAWFFLEKEIWIFKVGLMLEFLGCFSLLAAARVYAVLHRSSRLFFCTFHYPVDCLTLLPFDRHFSDPSSRLLYNPVDFFVACCLARARCALPACSPASRPACAASVLRCGCMWLHALLGWCMDWLVLHEFSTYCNFDQFSSNLYDFCMISTIPNNSTQKHK